MASITLEHVEKRFASGHAAVRDVSLQIPHGELVVLVGPSGSGKSTTLRLIAGLETPTAGRILIGDRDVTSIPSNARDLAMVFQSYALYPHKTVRDNLSFGLRMRGTDRHTIDARVAAVADSLQIGELLDRKPAQLSGGQRQRVAVGRAIVREPQAFLFDEPLSNLDPALRLETRTELALLHRRLGSTMVYVTHDQEEAMTLGQRIVVMRDGQIEQVAPPLELYRRPATLFVARFIGSPPMNIVDATWRDGHVHAPALARSGIPIRAALDDVDDDTERRSPGDGRCPANADGGQPVGGATSHTLDDAPLLVGVRPHEVDLVAEPDADITAVVAVIEPLGRELHLHVRTEPADVALTVVAPADSPVAVGDRVGLRARYEVLHFFEPRTGLRYPLTV